MMSTFPHCSMLFCITVSTVSLTLTSQSNPRQLFSCHLFICSTVFSCVHPTAVHLSPCAMTARTRERPMWPVAPKTIHFFWMGGFLSEGGSQVAGRCRPGRCETAAGERLWLGLSRSIAIAMSIAWGCELSCAELACAGLSGSGAVESFLDAGRGCGGPHRPMGDLFCRNHLGEGRWTVSPQRVLADVEWESSTGEVDRGSNGAREACPVRSRTWLSL
jgi:hypothetical protein